MRLLTGWLNQKASGDPSTAEAGVGLFMATRFPKQGKHSVGVARQYCGQLGKQDNCQVAVSLSLANHHASLPVAWRLYLPKEWASDEERRRKAGVPEEIEFRTKPQIALEQIEAACEAGLPRGVVLMDAGYGCNTQLRAGVSALALTYVAGILPNTTVWISDTEPPPPKKWSGRGRRPKRLRRADGHKPISVEELALGLPRRAWRKITWREGSCERLSSRFARVRVRAAHRDYTLTEPRPEEWLLVKWPEGEEKPTKYWFSTLPKNIAFRKLVDITKLRWRIERDYQELKQEVGSVTSKGEVGAASIITPRCASRLTDSGLREGDDSPSGPRSTAQCEEPAVPHGDGSRCPATANRASRTELHRDDAQTIGGRARRYALTMSVLRRADRQALNAQFNGRASCLSKPPRTRPAASTSTSCRRTRRSGCLARMARTTTDWRH